MPLARGYAGRFGLRLPCGAWLMASFAAPPNLGELRKDGITLFEELFKAGSGRKEEGVCGLDGDLAADVGFSFCDKAVEDGEAVGE